MVPRRFILYRLLVEIVRDLVTPFAALVDRTPSAALASSWRTEIVEPNRELFRAIEPWIDPAKAEGRLPDQVGDLLSQAERARGAIGVAHALLTAAVPDADPVQAVLLVGLGASNGWVKAVQGRPTLFLAVERLPDAGYDVVLALHELLHAVHMQREASDWPENRAEVDLFREGLAVHATARLLPQIEASGHLWFAPGRHDWIMRCEREQESIRRGFIADWGRTDVSARWFTGIADGPGPFPVRCGYWLGWRLLDRLLADETIATAVTWPLTEAVHRLRKAIEEPV